jgi:hypothetical protein
MANKIEIINTFINALYDGDININEIAILTIFDEDDNEILNYSIEELRIMFTIAYYIYEVENKFDLDKYMSKWK